MKLYIKSENINNKPGFAVYNDIEEKKYAVPIDHSVLGMKLDLYNSKFKMVAKIRQRGYYFNKTYVISANKKTIKLIIKISENSLTATIKGINWTLEGNISKKDFCILDASKSIVMKHKCNHINNSIYYELEIISCEDEILCICVALCIESLLLCGEKAIVEDILSVTKKLFEDKKLIGGLETSTVNNITNLSNELHLTKVSTKK